LITFRLSATSAAIQTLLIADSVRAQLFTSVYGGEQRIGARGDLCLISVFSFLSFGPVPVGFMGFRREKRAFVHFLDFLRPV
jgi:hypothetical protein